MKGSADKPPIPFLQCSIGTASGVAEASFPLILRLPRRRSESFKMDSSPTKVGKSSEALLPNYVLGKKLGNGSFGKVRLAMHTLTGNKVAVKILDLQRLNGKEAERVRREIQVLGSFSHPHIIRLLEVIEKKSKIYLVMEYMNGRELYYYIVERGRLPEDEARDIFQQIIFAVEFCHFNRVAHRDLKPENLLMDSERNVKLADFGLSNVMRDGHFLKTSCGSPNYAAPEILSGKHYSGPEVDVWSCGVILYVLLCGNLPFDAENFPILFKIIKDGLYTVPSHLSPGAKDLIYWILLIDPMRRIDISGIRKHPWFQNQLPPHLLVSPEEVKARANKIDHGILQEVVKIGFNHDSVIESLQNRRQNQETVTYYLLLDKQSRFSTNHLICAPSETAGCGTSNLSQMENKLTMTEDSLQEQSYPRKTRTSSSTMQCSGRRNWTLGLPSQARPNDIMREVFMVLRRLNISWKQIGYYNTKCLWMPTPNILSGSKISDLDLNRAASGRCIGECSDRAVVRSPNAIKFEIQLYKISGNLYTLDLQVVSGSHMLFLELCHSLLAQFHVI